MSNTIEHAFSSRRDAELAVERLVQEYGLERTDIFVSPAGDANSAGETTSGGDTSTHLETGRSDAALTDPITVSVDVNDEDRATDVRRVFAEIAGS